MRSACLLVTAILLCGNMMAQSPAKQFEKAFELYDDRQFDSALLIFKKIYHRGKGEPGLLAKAHYNIAATYEKMGDKKNAEKTFVEILGSNYDEMDRGGIGEGIMADPYAQFKHNASTALAEIAIEEKDFKKALKYTELFDKVYPYRHFCGNAFAANDIYKAWTYARCYVGEGDTARAISALLPQCIDNGLADHSDAQKMAIDLISKTYSLAVIRDELKKAMAGIYTKKEGEGKHSYEVFYIDLWGASIELTSPYFTRLSADERKRLSAMSEKDQRLYRFTESSFYKDLTKER